MSDVDNTLHHHIKHTNVLCSFGIRRQYRKQAAMQRISENLQYPVPQSNHPVSILLFFADVREMRRLLNSVRFRKNEDDDIVQQHTYIIYIVDENVQNNTIHIHCSATANNQQINRPYNENCTIPI